MSEAISVGPATVLQVAERVMIRTTAAEVVLLDTESEQFFGVDGAGARMIELISEPRTLASVVDTVLVEYEVERETLVTDLVKLAGELLDKNLVQVVTPG